MTDFYEKSTKAFDVIVYINGQLQDISSDTVSFVMKRMKTDSDEEAVLLKQAQECGANGVAKFVLNPEDTALLPRNYFYEIKWVNGSNVYILESDTVKVLDRIFD